MNKRSTKTHHDGIYEVRNPRLERAREKVRLIERLTKAKILDYCKKQPLLIAAEDDTGHFNDILKDVLLDQFFKLSVPKSKRAEKFITHHSNKIDTHSRVKTKINGIDHDILIESSITTDAMTSYVTNVRLTRAVPRSSRENPSHQLFVVIHLAIDGAGGVGLTEKISFEIDPTAKCPESVIASMIGQPLGKLIDSPLFNHPALQQCRIARLDNEGPFDQDGSAYMLKGKLGRAL